jgi:hypothetical protein
VPWPAPRTPRWRPALIGVAIAVGAGAVLWLAWPPRAREEAPRPVVAPSTLAVPVAAPATVAVPPVTLPTPVDRPVPVPDTTFAPAAPVKPHATARPEAGLQLQAIGERDGRPVAVISSRLVREGDHYDGVTIVRIGADEVEIEVQGRRRTLHF